MKFVKSNKNNLILFISILFLSCEVFYPYEDDCGVIDGSNKIVAGTCFDTDHGITDEYGDGCSIYNKYDFYCDSEYRYGDSNFNPYELCCGCDGGYIADGTEDCPYNPEIHK